MKYFLHKYDFNSANSKALKTFRSKRSLCSYMRKSGISAAEYAHNYFLHVLCSRCSGIYDLVIDGPNGDHLKAVLSNRIDFPVVGNKKMIEPCLQTHSFD